jgi:hypothetical protein
LVTDPATGDPVVRLTPGGSGRVRWWTVRALVDGSWRTWVLPGSQRVLTLAGVPSRVVVTAVDRYGTESSETWVSDTK